jgi:hypothetical protein
MHEIPDEGLSFELRERLAYLKRTKLFLQKQDPEHTEIVNIVAVEREYKSGDLKFNKDLVTYWVGGVQITEPAPYDDNVYQQLSEKYPGTWDERRRTIQCQLWYEWVSYFFLIS